MIVELETKGAYVGVTRGFLEVRFKGELILSEPFDQLTAVIVHSGISISSTLVSKSAESNVPLIFCNGNFEPLNMLIPIQRHQS